MPDQLSDMIAHHCQFILCSIFLYELRIVSYPHHFKFLAKYSIWESFQCLNLVFFYSRTQGLYSTLNSYGPSLF